MDMSRYSHWTPSARCQRCYMLTYMRYVPAKRCKSCDASVALPHCFHVSMFLRTILLGCCLACRDAQLHNTCICSSLGLSVDWGCGLEVVVLDHVQRYASKLGACLLETSEDANNPANRQLTLWVSEVTSVMICMAQGNPKLALKHGLADFTNNSQSQQAEPSFRPDAFFVDLLVSFDLPCGWIPEKSCCFLCHRINWRQFVIVHVML